METAGLYVSYKVDLSNFTQKVKRAQQTFENAAAKMQAISEKLASIGTTLTAGLTAPLALAAGGAIKMASDMEESLNKVDVAFKNSSKEVKEFAKTTLKEFGISQAAALDTAALFGDMATGMGLTTEEAAKMAISLTGLTGDLASFKNIQQDVAKTALAGIFTGETESLKQLGIVMTEANLDAFALANGFGKLTKQMNEAEKVNLRYAFIMQKTKNSQGDFARTSDGFANQMRILQGTIQEVATAFGKRLLPIATKLLSKIVSLADSFLNLSPAVQDQIILFAGVAAAIGPVLLGLAGLAKTVAFVASGLALINAPIALTAAALVAAGALIYTYWDKIADFFKSGKITAFMEPIIKAVKIFYYSLQGLLKDIRDFFISVWDSVGNDVLTVTSIFTDNLTNQFYAAYRMLIEGLRTLAALFRGDWETFFSGLENIAVIWAKAIAGTFLSVLQAITKSASSLAQALGLQMVRVQADSATLALESLKKSIKIDPPDFSGVKMQFTSLAEAIKTTNKEAEKSAKVLSVGGAGKASAGLDFLAPKKQTVDDFAITGMPKIKPVSLEQSAAVKKLIEQMETLKQLGDQITQTISVGLTDAFFNALSGAQNFGEALKQLLLTLVKMVTQAIILNVLTGGSAGAGGILKGLIPQFAAGGYHSGGLALVGEKGPELISTGAARVFNARQTEQMLAANMQPVKQTSAPVSGRIEMGTPTVRIKGQDLVIAFERAKLRERDNFGFNTVYREG